jgi:Protein of unknown function (DUF1570)
MSRAARFAPIALLAFLSATSFAMAEMRVFASHHYQVHTDLEPSVAMDLARRMDAMYEEYSRRMIRFDLDPKRPMVDAYLWAGREDYLKFAGPGMRSTGGVFMPSRNALAAVLENQGRDNLRRTLQHEAFHQFAAEAIRYPLPMWLNEGIAQYYEEGLWTGEGFSVSQVPPRRVRQLQSDIKAGRLMDFEAFTRMTPDSWGQALASRSATRGATQYNQAWAMVQYLLSTNDAAGEPMRNRLLQMLDLIHGGTDPDEAFVQAFSANYKGFTERFLDWAAKLQPTEEATYIERQGVLADMMAAMKQEYDRSYEEVEDFRKAVEKAKLEIHYSKGQIKWSSGKDTSLYFVKMNGSPFSGRELYLQARRGAPLPDIVCRCLPNSLLRTRFYMAGKQIEHELLIEAVQAGTGKPLASPLLRLEKRAK